MIERIILDLTAKLEAGDVRQTVVYENEVWLHLQAEPHGRFAILCGLYIALLALQKRFPFVAASRGNIHKQNGRIHAPSLQFICARRVEHTTPPSSTEGFLEGLELPAISNPCSRGKLTPLPGDEKE